MSAIQVSGRKVRYAVVGAGWIAQAAFMPGVAQTGNSELAALVTGDADKATALGQRYNLKTYGYDQFDAMLESGEVDAIYLALPNDQHRDFSVRALRAGVHLLLEKPMATSEEDCRAIIQAANNSGARLMVAYRLHFEPGTLAALEVARSGELGDIRSFSSVFSQHVAASNHRMKHGYWAGPVPDMGPYPINAARTLFGAEPTEVHAVGFRSSHCPAAFHDTVAVTLRFPEDRMAQFSCSYAGAPANAYRVVGTAGDMLVEPAYMFGPKVAIGYRTTIGGEQSQRHFPVVDQFGGETRYFSDCILNNRNPEPDGEEGLLDVRILAAIERALNSGQPQKLAPMTRARRAQPDQVQCLPSWEPPKMVNATDPSEG